MGREEGKLLMLMKFIETFCLWNVQTSYMSSTYITLSSVT